MTDVFISFSVGLLAVLIGCLPSLISLIAATATEHLSKRQGGLEGFDARNSQGEHSDQASRYRTFYVGKFRGTLLRKLVATPKQSGQGESGDDAGALRLITFFSVTIPPVQSFSFSLEFPNPKRYQAALSRQELLDALVWNIPERELEEAFHRPEALQLLCELFSLGSGRIACGGNDFSISINCHLTSGAELECFGATARKFFRVYAQVAQMNLPEWRSPENNYDWWSACDRVLG